MAHEGKGKHGLGDPRVLTLLGGLPGADFRKRPMPLEAEFRAQAELLSQRRVLVSQHSKAVFAPLQKIVAADKDALAGNEGLRRLGALPPPPRIKPVRPNLGSHIRSGSILALRFPPYDDGWAAGSGLLGSTASLDGTPLYDDGEGAANVNDGSFSATVHADANGNAVWAGGGVAVWFQPVSDNAYVRFAADAPGEGSWIDNSWGGPTAHNNALLGVLIESWDLQGNYYQVDVDRRIQLWSDGTGWWETHNDSPSFWFPNDTFFFASTTRWYRAWTWTEAWCDSWGQGAIGSIADAGISFDSYFMVFEQFT